MLINAPTFRENNQSQFSSKPLRADPGMYFSSFMQTAVKPSIKVLSSPQNHIDFLENGKFIETDIPNGTNYHSPQMQRAVFPDLILP
jgi:hypothetical protein